MSGEWVVLVEAASTSFSGEIDYPTLSRLLEAMEDAEPVALHSVHRYAVQLKVTAENPVEALSSALSRWTEAVHSVGAPAWEAVRAEVMTKAELEHELQMAPATGNVYEAPFNAGGAHVSQGRALAEQLLHDAFHDSLTGLAGESLLRDHLDRAIADAHRNGQRLGVLVVGLHAVRETSKTLGAAFRDAALVVLADRLLQAISPGDVAGRIGDDHFVVLRQNCCERQAVALCEQILKPMQAPITVFDREFEADVSVGVALSESGEDLLRNAVAALEMTRESPGKEPFAIFPG